MAADHWKSGRRESKVNSEKFFGSAGVYIGEAR